jgi:DnaK suppressor protein
MTALVESTARPDGGTASRLSADEIDCLRTRLDSDVETHRAHLTEYDAAIRTLGDLGTDDAVGFDLEFVTTHAAHITYAIEECEHALARIADGSYGSCETCSRSIPFERLEALPHARLCVRCGSRREHRR